MRRLLMFHVCVITLILFCGSLFAVAQDAFKIPFKFNAAGKKLPAGGYSVGLDADGRIIFRLESAGKEFAVPFLERIARPAPPLQEPRLVFHVVGNFEPSYTEYVTDYVLAEVWVTGQDGYLVHKTKGAHQTQVLKPLPPK